MTDKIINTDPYADVRLEKIIHNNVETDKVIVEMADENGVYHAMKGLGGVHGESYTLVPNSQVHELVSDVLTRTGKEFKPVGSMGAASRNTHTYWDGKKWSEKWYCDSINHEIGDSAIALGVEALNSYDGSYPVGIRFFAMHMLCANQFYTGNALGSFIFRHMNNDAGIHLQDNINDALQLIRQQADRFLEVAPRFKALTSKHVDGMNGYLELRSTMNKDFWKSSRDCDVLDELYGNGISKQMGIKQLDTDPTCYWNILNAYTAVSTHKVGGFNGQKASEKVTCCILDRTKN